jgi:protein phosphatase
MVDTSLYVFGGFELDSPNIPTDIISRVNIVKLLSLNEALLNKFNQHSSKK